MKDLISSVRVEHGPGHDHVHVCNRGGKAGVLVVNKGEGDQIAARLLDHLGETLQEIATFDVSSEFEYVDEWTEAKAFHSCQQKAREAITNE